jgi:hypothetical protein
MSANPETAMIVQLGNPKIWREPERLSPGVRPVLAAANFSQLPDDPSWEEIEELALLIDGSQLFHFHSYSLHTST